MNFQLLGPKLKSSEGETTVKAFHCTSLSSGILRLKAEGYLTVTNMRVIFYAFGSSYGGESIMHSEVPIADVSGINTYKGTYFSINHLLGALFLAFLGGTVVGAIVTGIVGFIVSILSDSLNFEATQIALLVVGFILVLVSSSFSKDDWRRPVFAATGTSVIAGGGISFAFGFLASIFGDDFLSSITILVAVASSIYTIVTLFWYARRETMSLTIGSRGGANTPIVITGATIFGFFNTAALKALTAEPANEADILIRELGALISDIQTLGDEGISKWKSG